MKVALRCYISVPTMMLQENDLFLKLVCDTVQYQNKYFFKKDRIVKITAVFTSGIKIPRYCAGCTPSARLFGWTRTVHECDAWKVWEVSRVRPDWSGPSIGRSDGWHCLKGRSGIGWSLLVTANGRGISGLWVWPWLGSQTTTSSRGKRWNFPVVLLHIESSRR